MVLDIASGLGYSTGNFNYKRGEQVMDGLWEEIPMTDVDGTVLRETELAIHVDCGGDVPVWLPKSQLEDWPYVGESGSVLLPVWLAEDKGLV